MENLKNAITGRSPSSRHRFSVPSSLHIVKIDGIVQFRLKDSVQMNSHRNAIKGRDVGANGNYLSHLLNPVISSCLAIRFTQDVVIPRNRATEAPVYPNFLTAT